jgi:hypothetical protein
MSDTEQKNKFDRARAAKAQPSLESDRKSRFDKAQELRDVQRADTTAHDERLAEREKRHNTWAGPGRAGAPSATTPGGTPLDPETARLKVASDAQRAAAQQPKPAPVLLSQDDLEAWAKLWEERHPNWYRSEFNAANFAAALLTNVANGKLLWRYDSFEAVGEFLEKEGYFEGPPAESRRRGDFIGSVAPKIYPPFTPAADAAREEELAKATAAENAAQADAAKKMSFADLQEVIRASFRTADRSTAALGGIR